MDRSATGVLIVGNRSLRDAPEFGPFAPQFTVVASLRSPDPCTSHNKRRGELLAIFRAITDLSMGWPCNDLHDARKSFRPQQLQARGCPRKFLCPQANLAQP